MSEKHRLDQRHEATAYTRGAEHFSQSVAEHATLYIDHRCNSESISYTKISAEVGLGFHGRITRGGMVEYHAYLIEHHSGRNV